MTFFSIGKTMQLQTLFHDMKISQNSSTQLEQQYVVTHLTLLDLLRRSILEQIRHTA